MPHDNSVIWCIPIRSPQRGRQNSGGAGKMRFSTGRDVSEKNLCPSAMVVRVQDGALTEGYAVSSTTLVVVAVC